MCCRRAVYDKRVCVCTCTHAHVHTCVAVCWLASNFFHLRHLIVYRAWSLREIISSVLQLNLFIIYKVVGVWVSMYVFSVHVWASILKCVWACCRAGSCNQVSSVTLHLIFEASLTNSGSREFAILAGQPNLSGPPFSSPQHGDSKGTQPYTGVLGIELRSLCVVGWFYSWGISFQSPK